jgi:hypothetical protein
VSLLSTSDKFQPACPHCNTIQLRLGQYLNPWSVVTCQRCGKASTAEEWFIKEELHSDWEVSCSAAVSGLSPRSVLSVVNVR